MAIRFKYDLATVAPPSNDLTRKFGQSLVLQQQQQKYSGQQAGYDRLFNAYKQQNQNAFAWNQAADNRVFQAKQQEAQNNFLTGRDQARLDQQAQQQRAADFNAARSRIDTHAKDMLANGNIKDPATRQRIQNLIAGKTIIMGSGFDETARQNYLDQYNAELAKILSEVPAPPTRDDELKGFLGSNYDKFKDQPWVPNGKGGFAIADIPQPAPASPTTPAEAFKAEPKTGDKYRDKAESRLMGTDGEMPQVDSGEVGEDGKKKKRDMTPQEFQREVNKLASELWGIDNPQPEKPTGFGSSSAAYYNAPDSEAKPPAADIPIAPPDPGQPPSPGPQKPSLPLSSNTTSQNPWAEASGAVQPTDTQAPPSAAEYDAEMTSKGYKLTTPADGGRPYYFKDFGSGPAQPGEAIPQAPTQGNASALPTVAPPDFGKLVGSATDDNEKAVISQIQGLVSQNADSPDIVNALHVFVSPGSSKEDRLAAFDYLSTAGIDLNQMIAEEPGRAEKIRKVQEKNQERFGNRRDLLNGM